MKHFYLNLIGLMFIYLNFTYPFVYLFTIPNSNLNIFLSGLIGYILLGTSLYLVFIDNIKTSIWNRGFIYFLKFFIYKSSTSSL